MEYLQKQDDRHKKTRLKAERATRPIPKRRRPLYVTATRPIPKRRRPRYATATRPIPKRRRPLYATTTTQILNLSNLLKGSDIKIEDVEENRAAKMQKYEYNSVAIKASERNRYWNDPAVRLTKRADERKRYRMGHRTTLPPKGMSWHVVLH